MKRIFGFGTFSDDNICIGIFITSFLIIFRLIYLSQFNISVNDSNAKMIIFNMYCFYIKFLEPIVIFICLKFICEFIYKCLKKK